MSASDFFFKKKLSILTKCKKKHETIKTHRFIYESEYTYINPSHKNSRTHKISGHLTSFPENFFQTKHCYIHI